MRKRQKNEDKLTREGRERKEKRELENKGLVFIKKEDIVVSVPEPQKVHLDLSKSKPKKEKTIQRIKKEVKKKIGKRGRPKKRRY